MDPHIRDALYQEIREHPREDLPRLVLADWLDEHGDAIQQRHAELIRVQCRLSTLSGSDPARAPLAERERELLQIVNPMLTEPLRPMASSWELRRGIVGRVVVRQGHLLANGEAILRQAPGAELTLVLDAEEEPTIPGCPALARVDRLECRGRLGDDWIARFVLSPHLGALRAIVMHSCGITEIGFAAMLAHLDLTRLTVLNLGANDLHDVGMEMLCSAPALANLELLSLGANELHLPAMVALANSATLHRLLDINLGANYFTDEAMEALAGAAHLASLHRLDVRTNEWSSRGAVALARSPYLEGLRELDASGNRLTEEDRLLLRDRFGDRVHF